MSQAIDIIPDLHADPERLARTLDRVGTQTRLAFLGDFIDAPEQAHGSADDAGVLERVRDLVERDRAIAIMGNHELNAILFHRTRGDGAPMRARDDKNCAQHKSFLDRFGTGTSEATAWTQWFLETLPLWRELDGLRLVHACWSPADIACIAQRRPDGFLKPEDLEEVGEKTTPFASAVDRLLTGPELSLPDGHTFIDAHGHERSEMRVAWWREGARSWRELALTNIDPARLPDGEPDRLSEHLITYPAEASPVLFGHYKMVGAPVLEQANAACLDYPAAPCVYQWRGEKHLSAQGLLTV